MFQCFSLPFCSSPQSFSLPLFPPTLHHSSHNVSVQLWSPRREFSQKNVFFFFFLVPYLSTPPPLTVTAAHSLTAFFSLDLSPLSNCTIAASPAERHSFVLTCVSFQIWRCQSHAFAISDIKTPGWSMHAWFSHNSLGSVCRHMSHNYEVINEIKWICLPDKHLLFTVYGYV